MLHRLQKPVYFTLF